MKTFIYIIMLIGVVFSKQITVSGGNVRALPDLKEAVIEQCKDGDVFTVLEEIGGWYEASVIIENKVIKGFIYSTLVEKKGGALIVIASQGATMRGRMETKSPPICYVKNSEKLNIIKQYPYFYKVGEGKYINNFIVKKISE